MMINWLRVSVLLFALLAIASPQCTSGYNCTACVVTGCSVCSSDINTCDTCSDPYFLNGTTCT